jgi:hypothetical protein
MSDWQQRSLINQDVVFFRYVSEGLEKSTDEVFVWDLDKTYLDTAIESIYELLKTVVERALNKKNVPGTNTLLQALAANWQKSHGHQHFPVYFITASPPQMENRIYEKLQIDNIKPFGCFYKDNLRNLTPKRFWRLTKQVGYKLQALLQLRTRLKEGVRQICWGDDSESDAIIYNLYSDICSRRMSNSDIHATLKSLFVPHEQIEQILLLQAQIPEVDPVEKIYINLATDTDPDYYLKFGRRTLPTYNTFQVVLDLMQDHRLPLETGLQIAQDMIYNYNFTPDELNKSFDELIRRKVLGETFVNSAMPFFKEKGIFASTYLPTVAPAGVSLESDGRVFELAGNHEPWVPDRIDYLHDYR